MNRFLKQTALMLGLVLALSIVTTVNAAEGGDDEQEIKASELPAAVQQAFTKAFPNARILGASRETEDGVTYFEIESKDGRQRRDLLFKADGTVVEMEELIRPKDLPEAVVKSVRTAYEDCDIERAEKITRNGVVQYEIKAETDEQDMEILVDADGSIVKSTTISEEEDED